MAFGDKPNTSDPATMANTLGLLQAAVAVNDANVNGGNFGTSLLHGLAGYTQGAGAANRHALEMENVKRRQAMQRLQESLSTQRMAREQKQEEKNDRWFESLSPEDQARYGGMDPAQYETMLQNRAELSARLKNWEQQRSLEERRLGQSAEDLAFRRGQHEEGKWQFDAKSGMAVNAATGQARPVVGQDGQALRNTDAAGESAVPYASATLGAISNARKLLADDSGFLPTSGAGALLSMVPGTSAKDLAANLDTVKAAVAFDRLAEMRRNSPTGGALGVVSDSEGRLLQSALGSLDQAQSAGQLTQSLDRVEKQYLNVIHGPGNWKKQPDGSVVVGFGVGGTSGGTSGGKSGNRPPLSQFDR